MSRALQEAKPKHSMSRQMAVATRKRTLSALPPPLAALNLRIPAAASLLGGATADAPGGSRWTGSAFRTGVTPSTFGLTRLPQAGTAAAGSGYISAG